LNSKKLVGVLFTGEGNGKKYLALPWVKNQLEEKLGYSPFLGTLNLRLTAESVKNKRVLLKVESTVVYPHEGYCVGLLYKASIRNLDCAIIAPQVKGYPENVLEVISRVNMRDTLKLKDGDTVTVAVRA